MNCVHCEKEMNVSNFMLLLLLLCLVSRFYLMRIVDDQHIWRKKDYLFLIEIKIMTLSLVTYDHSPVSIPI